jgi:hypothetical protein
MSLFRRWVMASHFLMSSKQITLDSVFIITMNLREGRSIRHCSFVEVCLRQWKKEDVRLLLSLFVIARNVKVHYDTISMAISRRRKKYLFLLRSFNILSLRQIGTEPSDNQYLVVDIGLAAVPIIMIGNCGPHHALIEQKPSRHLLSFIPLFSVISYLFFQALCYIGVWFYLHSQPW